MPKVKIPRKSTLVDMTAMVDMGFLLVTFFMLATKFKPDDPFEVKIPSATATIESPEKGIILITITKEGKVFLGMDNPEEKKELVERVMFGAHRIQLSKEQITTFANQSSFGMPIAQIKNWLDLPPEEMKKQSGIPCDSLGGELYEWVLNARKINVKNQIMIKGDADADYPMVKNVIKTLANERVKAFRFNLVTDLEKSRMK
jgi:biopolymer transport protein ExbD